jgi:Hypothetical protein (DUF2513)
MLGFRRFTRTSIEKPRWWRGSWRQLVFGFWYAAPILRGGAPEMQIYDVPRRSVAVHRDMDLIRDILLRVDDDPRLDGTHFVAFDKLDDFPGHSVQEVTYHADLLFEAGLVKGSSGSEVPLISKLTWDGHEFVANTRDPGIWAKVKERTHGLVGIGIGVLSAIAEAEIKKKLGL